MADWSDPEKAEEMQEAVSSPAKKIDLTTEAGKELAGILCGKLENLSQYEDEDCLLGTVHILGVGHHVTFVRVYISDVDGCVCPTRDPHGRLEDILASCYDGPPATVKLPGLEGRWVIGVDPFRD